MDGLRDVITLIVLEEINMGTLNNRHYIIFNTTEISSIDFSEVLETSSETLRLSIDETKTFVKYEGETVPNSVSNLITKQGPYSHEQILTILNGSEWVSNDDLTP
jgi:hypothetical protein